MTPPHKNDVIIRRVAVARHAVFNCPKRLVEQADRSPDQFAGRTRCSSSSASSCHAAAQLRASSETT
jgi:hypothetical protein